MNTVKPTTRTHLVLSVALAFALPTGVAYAQSTQSNNSTGSSNSAVSTDNTADKALVAPSALEKGSNSFTEGEVRSRLQSAGISDVTDLKKDDAGIWRGKAKHSGKSVSVGLDYKGHMSAE